jgi:protein gp37
MAENSNIEWTHHTFNPWRGCTKVSPGCVNCYADTLSKRNPATLGVWGKHGSRVVAAESYWRQPLSLASGTACSAHRWPMCSRGSARCRTTPRRS